MQRTFPYRRREVVEDAPLISEFVNRWPALFTVTAVFRSRGGAVGKKIRLIMAPTAKSVDIELKRDCILRSLCIYLSEDSSTLIKEYLDTEGVEMEITQTITGLYVIRKEGADEEEMPQDVGVVIKVVEVRHDLRNISCGCAMLFGLIYTLNLSYPQELKFTFEFFQKVLMNLDGNKLSPKVQALKIKMLQ